MFAKISSVKVYGVPFSVHTRKVLVAAALKRIDHEVIPVVPVVPDELPADWHRISPTGLIPAIEHDGLTITDSTAIALYFERLVPEPSLLPTEAREYARTLSLDAWAGSLFQRVVQPLFHQLVVGPKLHAIETDQAIVEAARSKARVCFEFLERTLEPETETETEGRFLIGQHLSLADVAVISNLIVFRYLEQQLDEQRYPRLAAYFQSHVARPAFATALAREKPFVERMGLRAALT